MPPFALRKQKKEENSDRSGIMKKLVTVHLGLWILAVSLIGGFATHSLLIIDDPAAAAATGWGQISSLRNQRIAIQDPKSGKTVYVTALAHGYR